MAERTCAHEGCDRMFAAVTCKRFCSVECRKLARSCCTCGTPIPEAPGTKPRYCASCEAERARDRRTDPAVRASTVAAYRVRLYGITPEDYDRMLAHQHGVCAVCRKPETATRRGAVKTLAVDHDHETGRVRGLLCQRCNTAIGLLGDDPTLMAAAIAYLDVHAHVYRGQS